MVVTPSLLHHAGAHVLRRMRRAGVRCLVFSARAVPDALGCGCGRSYSEVCEDAGMGADARIEYVQQVVHGLLEWRSARRGKLK